MQLKISKLEQWARWMAAAFVLLVVATYWTYSHVAKFAGEQPQPMLILGPATEVLLDRVPTRISGFDECPRNEGLAAVAAGDVGRSPEAGCIALGGNTARVRYVTNGQVKEEVLFVIHAGDRTSLRRADGSPVISTAQ